MGLLYAIFSIFITLIFPKQITDVICYGRHRDRENYKHEGDFTLVYYIRKNEDNLDDLIKQIVQENNSIYKRYQLNEIDVVYETNGIYYICEKGR